MNLMYLIKLLGERTEIKYEMWSKRKFSEKALSINLLFGFARDA